MTDNQLPTMLDFKKIEVQRILHTILMMPNSEQLSHAQELILLLNQLLRIREVTPPISEIMIVLGHQKSKLFHAARLLISLNSNLKLLFEIKGDPGLAYQRLQEYIINIRVEVNS